MRYTHLTSSVLKETIGLLKDKDHGGNFRQLVGNHQEKFAKMV
ncbi:MAG: hypothetical protein ABIE43_03940 [Patescibacteria group bacterium]